MFLQFCSIYQFIVIIAEFLLWLRLHFNVNWKVWLVAKHKRERSMLLALMCSYYHSTINNRLHRWYWNISSASNPALYIDIHADSSQLTMYLFQSPETHTCIMQILQLHEILKVCLVWPLNKNSNFIISLFINIYYIHQYHLPHHVSLSLWPSHPVHQYNVVSPPPNTISANYRNCNLWLWL